MAERTVMMLVMWVWRGGIKGQNIRKKERRKVCTGGSDRAHPSVWKRKKEMNMSEKKDRTKDGNSIWKKGQNK